MPVLIIVLGAIAIVIVLVGVGALVNIATQKDPVRNGP